jgi:transcriptional regulator with XRE-family HTH domain
MTTAEPTRRKPIHWTREWRLVRGMRQEDLAKAVGTVKSLISRYETGETGMSFEMQLRIMEALRITPTEFFLAPPDMPDDPRRLRERQQFFKRKALEREPK